MDLKNRSLDLLLDQREEVILIGLLRSATEGEACLEELRQQLCSSPDFEPYAAFKLLQSNPLTSHVLSSHDVAKWLARQYFKNTLLSERNIQNIFDTVLASGSARKSNSERKSMETTTTMDSDAGLDNNSTMKQHHDSDRLLKYENFLKLVLPREDKAVRNLAMSRRKNNDEGEITREAGYILIRLLEQEANLHEELTLRKKRLLEYEWREDLDHFTERAFTWLQSQSAIPGVTHVSVLGVCRLLCDVKEVMTTVDVHRMFHRINLSGNDMLSYVEFEKFLQCREATQYLNELYVKYFTTLCPGCGSMCQRDGGGCNNVTCGICRTTFRCDTLATDAPKQKAVHNQSNHGRGSSPVRAGSSTLASRMGSTSSRINLVNNSRVQSASPKSNKGSASLGGGGARLDYSTLNRSVVNDRSPSASFSPSSRKKMNETGSTMATLNQSLNQSPMSQTTNLANNTTILNASFMSSPRAEGSSPRVESSSPRFGSSARVGSPPRAQQHSPRAQSPRIMSRGENGDNLPIRGANTTCSPRSMGSPKNAAPSSFKARENAQNDSKKSGLSAYGSGGFSGGGVPNHLSSASAEMKYRRQKASLRMVQDIMYQQVDLDNFMEQEKEALWQQGINIEATFNFLDRYSKSYIADTDIWQIMHNAGSSALGGGSSGGSHSDIAVSFAGVCSLFRDVKWRDAKKPGQLNLAEVTQFLFPRESEEWQQTHPFMLDSETKSVLYIVRSTVACPGCGARTQRTVEGCPQVTCPCCGSVFRCNLIGDDRDQSFKLTLTQQHRVRQYLKVAVDAAEEQERLRKALAVNGYSGDSLSSILLDAFLVVAQDKGYCTFQDFKRILLQDKPSLRYKDLELIWFRYARDNKKIGFVEFASQLRPFGVN